MSKLHKAKFFGYLQGEDWCATTHIFVFEVKIKPKFWDILFCVTSELKQCLDVINDEEYFKFCYQLAILANSKNVNFEKLKGKECLVEVINSKIIGVFPKNSNHKGGQNGK